MRAANTTSESTTSTARPSLCAAPGSAFRIGAKWNLGEYGVRSIKSTCYRKMFPDSKRELICCFGAISKDVGLQVGARTLRKCYSPHTPNTELTDRRGAGSVK